MGDQDRQPGPEPGQAAPRAAWPAWPAWSGVEREPAGTIFRGPGLPRGCPLDSGCDGWHAGRQP